ncbi:MAG TPA: SigE family RNA polymerase sigma factor [Pilimelia sp.]|nr:SigE family RNA polymerase sigma factor [Pilimelia sp.]
MTSRSTVEEEFRQFVAARSPALLRTAYLLAGDWATAEDLLQTALTKTYLAWKRLGAIEAVEPYTRRVLVNTATSWWRRRWHGERPTEVLPERAAPDRMDEGLERDALWRHVKELPARQRAVLVLRFYEDLSEAQTAAMLGISVGTVKSQTSRAVGALRQRLAAEGVEPALRRLPGPPRRSPAPAVRAADRPVGRSAAAPLPGPRGAGLAAARSAPGGGGDRGLVGPAGRGLAGPAERDVVGAYGGPSAGAGCAAGSPAGAARRSTTPAPRASGGPTAGVGGEPAGPAPRRAAEFSGGAAPAAPEPGPRPVPPPEASRAPLAGGPQPGRVAKR